MKTSLSPEQRMQCLEGTFAVENIAISSDTKAALKRLEAGEASMNDLLHAAIARHSQKH